MVICLIRKWDDGLKLKLWSQGSVDWIISGATIEDGESE